MVEVKQGLLKSMSYILGKGTPIVYSRTGSLVTKIATILRQACNRVYI